MEYTDSNLNITRKLRSRLDSLLEGVQIIDFNWRYVYMNDAMIRQSHYSREELIGHSMMEKYPEIENTPLFDLLQKCMAERTSQRFENEFTFPDRSSRWFELFIEPDEEGICILSLDITPYKEALRHIEKGKTLYAFLSQINQNIVHVNDEITLFQNSCEIATRIGKFKVAWIGIYDEENKTIKLVAESGLSTEEALDINDYPYESDIPQKHILQTQNYYSCNDIGNELDLSNWKPFVLKHEINSCIVLPIKKSGKVIGTFNLYSDQLNFTGPEEIALLEEVTSDISFAIDIFEKNRMHKKTEELVLKNEKKFRALIEKSADMKTLATREGRIIYASPSITKILGYPLKQMQHSYLFEIIHPNDLPGFLKKRDAILKAPGKSFRFRMRLLHKKGYYVWCEGSGTNLLEDPDINAVVSNFSDISEKKLVEQQAEFDKNNLNALINSTQDLMWSVGSDLKMITSNKPFDAFITNLYGKPLAKGEYVFTKDLSPENTRIYKKFYQRVLNGESFTEILQIVVPDGNWSEISFTPIRKGSEIVGIACHSRDISERMKSDMKLEKQNKQLLKTNFELDRFVYSVSHDLRSPLTSILGLLAIIESESKEAEMLEHVKMIRSRIYKLDGFIKNILNYSRNNRTGLEIEKIPVYRTVADVVEKYKKKKGASEIDFKINIHQQESFYSDRLSLCTVLDNIISNAIKFRANDKENQYISIEGVADETHLNLVIEDNGIGIAEHQLDRIFDMFFRTSAKIEGSGIGLYIAKEIVEKLRGSIKVKSKEGKGTSFNIQLQNIKP